MSCALLGAGLVLTACGGGDGSGPGVASLAGAYAGTYAGTRLHQEATCAPAPLPAPVGDRGGWWVSVPRVGSSKPLRLQVIHAGAQVVFTEVDAAGRQTDDALVGSIAEDGAFSAARTREYRLEGPRQGGSRFFVAERLATRGAFARSSGGPARFDLTATLTYEFVRAVDDNEGPYRGDPFTTCVLPFTSAGVRGGA